jgi:hypothetical protein
MCEKLIENFNSLKINIFKELDQFEGKINYLNNVLKLSEYQKACNEYLNVDTIEEDKPKLTGFIYAIRSPNTEKIYIGSTFKDINKRLRQHILSGKTTSSQIIAHGEPYVTLIEEFKCDSRIELCRREGHHIKENKNIVVNYVIAGSTLQESQKRYRMKYDQWYKDYMKQWRKDNADKIKEYYLNKKKI